MKKLEIEYFVKIKVLLKLLGLWPREPNQCRFCLCLICILHHTILAFIDLFNWIHDSEHVFMNFVELFGYIDILLMMLILKVKIPDLEWILSRIEDDFNTKEDLTFKQKKIFQKYHNRTDRFVKSITPFLIAICFGYYVSPLTTQLKNSHSTFLYQLPLRAHVYFETKNPWMYVIGYIFQLPVLLISSLMRAASDSMLVSMTLHICGQLSVLRIQINNLEKTSHLKTLSQIFDRHIHIIRYVQVLKTCFRLVLFNHLIQGTITLGITGYFISWHLKQKRMMDFATAFSYALFTIGILFMYSWLGQSLINENEKLYFAFYNCNWLEMHHRQARLIIVPLMAARNSLHLLAFNTFVFSMNGFSEIVQTAFAYMSILHKVV